MLSTTQTSWVNSKDLRDWVPTSKGDIQLGFSFAPQLENKGSKFLPGVLGRRVMKALGAT